VIEGKEKIISKNDKSIKFEHLDIKP